MPQTRWTTQDQGTFTVMKRYEKQVVLERILTSNHRQQNLQLGWLVAPVGYVVVFLFFCCLHFVVFHQFYVRAENQFGCETHCVRRDSKSQQLYTVQPAGLSGWQTMKQNIQNIQNILQNILLRTTLNGSSSINDFAKHFNFVPFTA